jgi:hemolysin III
MRQRLTALALAGTKVATAGLLQQDYVEEGEAIELVGERQALIGDDDQVAAIIEITRVETHRFLAVPWEFADAEGEGFRSIEHWREGHQSYYAQQAIDVDETTPFVCVWFRVLERRTEDADGAAVEVKPKWRGVSHEVAAFVFPVLGLVLVAVAHTTAARWSALVYTSGVTAMYATSACYHRGRWSPSVRRRLRRLDHSMILVGIAATYTPIAVVGLDARSARVLLGVVWPLAIAGIVVQMSWLNAPRWLVAGLYVVIGWTALAFVPVLWRDLGGLTFSLIVAGGVVYSVGARVYSTRRPDPAPAVFGFHEVFHALVVAAGLLFYVAIARVIAAG